MGLTSLDVFVAVLDMGHKDIFLFLARAGFIHGCAYVCFTELLQKALQKSRPGKNTKQADRCSSKFFLARVKFGSEHMY